MSKRLTRKSLDEVRRMYHMDLPKMGCQRCDDKGGHTYTCHLAVESLVNEIEACWQNKDTSSLLNQLRVLVGKEGLAVYDIHIRKAGYGISYAKPVEIFSKVCSGFTVNATVYDYYPTLRKAVVGEIKMWKGKHERGKEV